MKEITSAKTRTFMSGKYRIDIIEKKDEFEAWIYHKDYGIKKLMFGVPKKNWEYDRPITITFDDFMEMVESSLPEDKEIYRDRYEF